MKAQVLWEHQGKGRGKNEDCIAAMQTQVLGWNPLPRKHFLPLRLALASWNCQSPYLLVKKHHNLFYWKSLMVQREKEQERSSQLQKEEREKESKGKHF